MASHGAALKYQKAATSDAENCDYARVSWTVDEDTESGAIPVQIVVDKLLLGDYPIL
jgi:hypothetical protein